MDITTILALGAAILAIVALVRAQGRNETAWAALLLALIYLIPLAR